MSDLAAKVSVQITFKFANNEVYILNADETARDKVAGLKARIDMWGTPTYIETGTTMVIVPSSRRDT